MTSSSGGDANPGMPPDAIEVGRIGEAWGVKGWFRVQAFAGDPQALFSSKRWFLKAPDAGAVKRPGGAAAMAALPGLLKIIEAKSHGDGVVAHAHGFDDRMAAESLRGALICVSRASFPTADSDEFYWVDLIGLQVVNREGRALGSVLGLIDTGPHAVLRIAPEGTVVAAADETLIPFVAAYVDGVDLDGRRITVDWSPDF